MSFIYNNDALPSSKIDSSGSSAAVANPTKRWSANDANAVFTALTDIRTALTDEQTRIAVGDGVTDVTTTLQAAIDAAESAAGVVYMPSGVHVISDTIFIPSKVVVSGVGRADTGKILASASFPTDGRPMIRLGRSADSLVFGTRIENIIIDANQRAAVGVMSTAGNEQSGVRKCVVTRFTQYGLHFNGSSGVVVEDCEIYPQASGATTGIYFQNTALDNLVKRTTIGVSGLLAKGLDLLATQCIVVGLHIENCTTGVNLGSNSSGVFIGVNGPSITPNVTDLILDNGVNHFIGISLVKASCTNLIRSLFGGYTITDAFMPLWVGGDSILGGATHLPREDAPAQITSNQNDYNPGGQYSSVQVLRLTSDAARDITGLVAANRGRWLWLYNDGSFNITLKHQNAGSATANRFIGRAGADTVLLPGTGVQIHYSSQSRWRVMNNP